MWRPCLDGRLSPFQTHLSDLPSRPIFHTFFRPLPDSFQAPFRPLFQTSSRTLLDSLSTLTNSKPHIFKSFFYEHSSSLVFFSNILLWTVFLDALEKKLIPVLHIIFLFVLHSSPLEALQKKLVLDFRIIFLYFFNLLQTVFKIS